MNKQQVWHKIKHNTITKGRQCDKCKWLFKIIINGIFCACSMVFGYCQIPGVDFSENYLPVVHYVTFQILVLVLMVFGLKDRIKNAEPAFLHVNIEEEIFMEFQPGTVDAEVDDKLPFNECIYGLVQAQDSNIRRVSKFCTKLDSMVEKLPHACFGNITLVAMYVDNNMIVGHPKAIEDTIKQLKNNGFVVKVQDDFIIL